MEESLNNEREDQLSELPESLILHILSFLPMRDVVSTTFLSKSWTNFWTIIPFRDFSEIISEEDDEPDSRNFVNRALILGERTKLLKLCLSSDSFEKKSLFPPLPSVVYLEVGAGLTELVEMVNLLEILPNLKMLVIKDHTLPDINAENCLDFKTNLFRSFLHQLKIIEITSCFSKSSIFRCIEFLLKHCSIEELVIRVESGQVTSNGAFVGNYRDTIENAKILPNCIGETQRNMIDLLTKFSCNHNHAISLIILFLEMD